MQSRSAALAAAMACAVAAAAGFASSYELRLLTLGGIYALLVIGYQFIFGHAGAFSLAQGTFFGLGAYVSGVLATAAGWGFAASFPLALLVPVMLAAIVAAPVLRLHSHYFALATLGIAEVVRLVAVDWQDLTGGANGLPGIPAISLAGLAVPRGLPLLALVSLLLLAASLLAIRATGGAWGLAMQLQRSDPVAAAALGIDGGRLRRTAFLLSAAYAGAAGALYAHATGVVSPDVVEFPVMIACLTMAVLGGPTRVLGGILAAFLLIHLPEWLRVLGGAYLLAYGAILLAAVILLPDGLLGAVERQIGRRKLATWSPPPHAEIVPRPAPPSRDRWRLETVGLTRRFGAILAVNGIGLALAPGEILGLIGPNGSGKTTLINLIAGLDRPDGGTIRLDGVDATGLPAHLVARAGLARSFQTSRLVAEMSGLDWVAMAHLAGTGAIMLRRSLAQGGTRELAPARAVAAQLLARLGVAEEAALPCGALPLGPRRRIEIAGALALRPRVLLLDEPAAGLSAAEQADLARRLADLASDGTSLVVVEHDMGFLMPLAHRVLCLDRGRVVAEGSPAQIQRDPRALAVYLGEPNDHL